MRVRKKTQPIVELTNILVTDIPLNPNDLFSRLPTELIAEILSYISRDDLKKHVHISRLMQDVINEYFLNSFYGDMLRFNRWQQTQLSNLEKSVREFKNTHQVTFFNRPHENRREAISYYWEAVKIAFFCLGGAVMVIKNERDLVPNISKDMAFAFRCAEAAVIIGVLAVILTFSLSNRSWNRLHHDRYQRLTSMTDTHKQFLDSQQNILAGDLAITSLQINVSTLLQVVNALDVAIATAKQNASQLSANLHSQCSRLRQPFKEYDVAVLAKLGNENSHFGNYARNLLGFWLQHIRPSHSVAKETASLVRLKRD